MIYWNVQSKGTKKKQKRERTKQKQKPFEISPSRNEIFELINEQILMIVYMSYNVF